MATGAGLVVSLWNKYIVPRLPNCRAEAEESDSDNSATMASSDMVHHDFSL